MLARSRHISLSPLLLAWLGTAAFASLLAVYATEFRTSRWEVVVVQFIQGLQLPGLHQTDLWLTRAGHTPLALPLTVLAVGGIIAAGHLRLGALLAVATLGRIVGGAIKILVDRPRPDAGQVDLAHIFGGPSFPSGHVLGTTLLLGWIAYAAIDVIPHRPSRLAVQAACVVGMVMMGISRIELGAHWPTDVLGGYAVAALMLLPLMWVHERLTRRPKLSEDFAALR